MCRSAALASCACARKFNIREGYDGSACNISTSSGSPLVQRGEQAALEPVRRAKCDGSEIGPAVDQSSAVNRMLLLFTASAIAAPKSCLKVLDQELFVEWLAQEADCAGLQDAPADFFFGKRSDEDHWRAVAPPDQ
jgi:hypothetical protein